MRRAFPTAICVTAWAVLVGGHALPAVDATMAAETATAFAQAVGLPWGAELQTVEEAGAGRYGDRTHFQVKYFEFADVTIDAADGSIVAAHNGSGLAEFMAKPTKVNLTEADALVRATAIAEAMGLSRASAVLHDVKLQEFTEGELYKWHIRWVRTINGIPYDSDMAIAMLDPATGSLLGAGKAFWSAPPETTDVVVSKDQALQSARAYARTLGIHETSLPASVELKVVQPNNYWDMGTRVPVPFPGFSRVAWVVTLRVPSPAFGPEAVAEKVFWIDAADGRLLGGTQSMGAAGDP